MTIADIFNLTSTALLIGSAGAYFGYKKQRAGLALFGAAFLVMAVKSVFTDGDMSLVIINGAISLVFVVKALTMHADR
ncbi:hypothetical protein [Streptomyces sp. NPDC051572]|uniref:hypothetical protein n=1 Tax=Streptomyces sp. NPDC051572 TaxID=3155802 RepID=UPI00344D1826